MRVGMGFDVHAFDPDRQLVLGGVSIAGAPGLAGWSDADALSHAIADALLGAGGLGDLGHHFPKDAVLEGVSSQDLLSEVARLVQAAGYRISNLDATVIVQDVKIGPHRSRMEETLAATLGVDRARVSVKATTTDHLGFTGRGEGIAAMAVALIEPA
ncbi:MAG: 2-C-methyl-D-erythritol 2,4-cyclodiphosphate synthase [Actinomycetota bacterium]|nr:2-C-methyl-D-erythritol 2,4-cyclodiphosphate synthase [Actinomycetota bacterium]